MKSASRLFESMPRSGGAKFSDHARYSLWMILFWTLWLTLVTTWPVPFGISIPGTAFMILFGGYWWSVIEGAAYLLLMSFIYTSVSLTPSGFFWLSCFIVFAIVKVASLRLSIRSPVELALGVFFVALFLELAQLSFLSQVVKVPHTVSLSILGSIFLSAMVQAFLSFFVSRPYQSLLSAR